MSLIHSTAVIDPQSRLGQNVRVGPYSVIGPDVQIGDFCEILNNVTVIGPTTIGKNTQIHPYTVIGGDSQDKKYDRTQEKNCKLEIGENCYIREFCTINRGSHGESPKTVLGRNCHVLAYSHIGHDCKLGDSVTFSNATVLAGHVKIGKGVITGGEVGIHQFVEVGDYCMLASRSLVKSNVPPYLLASGLEGVYAITINKIGLERNGIPSEEIEIIEKSFKIFYRRKNLLKKDALEEIRTLYGQNPKISAFIEFIETKGNICS